MPTFNDARVRPANDRPVNRGGRYVLLWPQLVRRLHASHALDYALHWCRTLKRPLVVYEGLKLNYPWANARHHAFILDGMRDTAAAAARLGVAYWPFVETPGNPGRGLVRELAADACLVVTDDYPAYIVPAQNRAVAAGETAVHLVDGNCLVPLSLLGPAVSAAAHLRPRIHRQFAEAWGHRAAAEPDVPKVALGGPDAPFATWVPPADTAAFVKTLPVDPTVPPVPGVTGGTAAGREVLRTFVDDKLPRYGTERNSPDDPDRTAASRLSPYLHYGHVGIQEVAEAVLGPDWTPADIDPAARGKREGFFGPDANANAFLDESITWRDVGYQWHWAKSAECASRRTDLKNVSWEAEGSAPHFNFESFDFSPGGGERTLDVVLPEWAKATLRKHAGDRREHLHSAEEFENGETHDELWNAAQRELVATGRIHNYLRMLWAKKVLEWSESPAAAYRVLEHLNNKYAVDGRDPNSYTGILWCFGLFDRPWAPERPVYGSVRYMSSDATARKFKVEGYYRYVRSLPSIAAVRAGDIAPRPTALF